jgi:hypothetical protein
VGDRGVVETLSPEIGRELHEKFLKYARLKTEAADPFRHEPNETICDFID